MMIYEMEMVCEADACDHRPAEEQHHQPSRGKSSSSPFYFANNAKATEVAVPSHEV